MVGRRFHQRAVSDHRRQVVEPRDAQRPGCLFALKADAPPAQRAPESLVRVRRAITADLRLACAYRTRAQNVGR
jgi:hypothetical protein